jgi:hypothetical protein
VSFLIVRGSRGSFSCSSSFSLCRRGKQSTTTRFGKTRDFPDRARGRRRARSVGEESNRRRARRHDDDNDTGRRGIFLIVLVDVIVLAPRRREKQSTTSTTTTTRTVRCGIFLIVLVVVVVLALLARKAIDDEHDDEHENAEMRDFPDRPRGHRRPRSAGEESNRRTRTTTITIR